MRTWCISTSFFSVRLFSRPIISPAVQRSLDSVLQTIRKSRSSLANHIHATHLGHYHFPGIHDRLLPLVRILCPFYLTRPSDRDRGAMDVVGEGRVEAVE